MDKHTYAKDINIICRVVTANDIPLLEKFSCKNKALDDYIHDQSYRDDKNVTYLFINSDDNDLIGFCSLNCNAISCRMSIDEEVFVSNLSAVEIDFFAIDEKYRSLKIDESSPKYETLSKLIFCTIIERIQEISNTIVGATHIVLYAVTRAVSFYKRCGFQEFEGYMLTDEHPFLEGCTPMFYAINE